MARDPVRQRAQNGAKRMSGKCAKELHPECRADADHDLVGITPTLAGPNIAVANAPSLGAGEGRFRPQHLVAVEHIADGDDLLPPRSLTAGSPVPGPA